ncbi:MAG TPA: hypothetical protein ENJ23_05315 [Bacteroidetes bacterium]|nr:hypothetical protein [Bacteroidota bacterium]
MNCRETQKWIRAQENLPAEKERLPNEVFSHLKTCEACSALFGRHLRAQAHLQGHRRIQVPGDVLEDVLPGVYRKLEDQHEGRRRKGGAFPLHVTGLLWKFRPAVAAVAAVLIALGIWWFGLRSSSTTEMVSTDSLEYYLESFEEESASNPVAVVKGMEYEWAYFGGEQ